MNTNETVNNTVNPAAAIQAAVEQAKAEMSPEDIQALAMQQEIERLKQENAKIQAAKAAKTPAPKTAETAAKTPVASSFAGTYPANATPAERLVLDAIHMLKSKPKEGGKVYDVQACFGKALYCYFHQAGVTTEQLKPVVQDACKRGILTRIFTGNDMLYFDAREKAAKVYDNSKSPSATAKSAIAAAFGK